MNKRIITHGFIISAIVIAAFIAAAFTPVETYAKTSDTGVIQNLARIDHENGMNRSSVKMIPDNNVPLAAVPSEAGINMTLIRIIVAASAIMSGIVIYTDLRDKKGQRR
ncbi:MAG: hypothetical protein J5574_07105 [Lachnospiraceae bacterium]|nr:hypothetical protein [Lachnospiraceae bacterium]